MKKDYYEILGLSKEATKEEIKKKYRELAKKYHPDKQPDINKKEADDMMAEINEAYEVLSNEAKREKYDNSNTKDTGTNFDDILRKACADAGVDFNEVVRKAEEQFKQSPQYIKLKKDQIRFNLHYMKSCILRQYCLFTLRPKRKFSTLDIENFLFILNKDRIIPEILELLDKKIFSRQYEKKVLLDLNNILISYTKYVYYVTKALTKEACASINGSSDKETVIDHYNGLYSMILEKLGITNDEALEYELEEKPKKLFKQSENMLKYKICLCYQKFINSSKINKNVKIRKNSH